MTIYDEFVKSIYIELAKTVRKSLSKALSDLSANINNVNSVKYKDAKNTVISYLTENGEDVIYKCAEKAVPTFDKQIELFKSENQDLSVSISDAATLFLKYNDSLPGTADDLFSQLAQNILIDRFVGELEKENKKHIYVPLTEQLITRMLNPQSP